MARLRFPGRPGHRFDRISVRYFADDVKNISDPAIAFLPQFKRGLQLFRELVGESDEEEEFEGFLPSDVQVAEKKLQELKQEQEKSAPPPPDDGSPPVEPVGTRLKTARQSIDNLPTAERTRGRAKMVVTKMIKEGIAAKSKTLKSKSQFSVPPEDKHKGPKIKITKVHVSKTKPTSFQLDQKHDIPGSKVKKSDKDMAKFLLEKAKQAQKLAQQKREKVPTKTHIQRKEFVLPTQSSRSSRVIIPNKRFLEDDSIHSIVKKKSKPENVTKDEIKSPGTVNNDKQIGLLDKPLILAGKRERKMSLKMRQKSSDGFFWEDIEQFQEQKDNAPFKSPKSERSLSSSSSSPTSVLSSPLAAPKLGTSLFSNSGSQFQKASEQQRLGMMGLSSRKQGTSIVQKAKLQLNRAALNKSKAALARSLKAQMKREAQFEELSHQQQNQDSKLQEKMPVDVATAADGSPNPEVKKPRVKKQCAVCKSKENLVSSGSALACIACRNFYWKVKKFIGVKQFVCTTGKGNCSISPGCKKTACRACRLKKCLEGGFKKGEDVPRLKQLFYKKSYILSPDSSKKSDVSTSKATPPHTRAPSLSPPHTNDVENAEASVKSPVPTYVFKSPSDKIVRTPVRTPSLVDKKPESTLLTEVKSELNQEKTTEEREVPVKTRTVSGEIREHKRKKQKAFKELLKAKQERSENLLALPDTPKSAPLPVSPSETTNTKTSPQSSSRGPRIKHVCRNAAMVLGKTPARFPSVSEIRLSALPTKDKVQLWKKEEAVKAARVDSDDERPIEEIIQHSSDNVCVLKKSPAKEQQKKMSRHPALKQYKRRLRCKKCAGCLADFCGTCRNCLDMPKFGGPGVMKQACVKRKCSNPVVKRAATTAFLDLKSDYSGTDSNAGSAASSPRKTRSADTQKSALSKTDSQTHATNSGEKTGQNTSLSVPQVTFENTVNTASEVRRLDFGSVPSILDSSSDQSFRMPSRSQSGKINSKRLKVEVQEKYAKKKDSVDGQFYPVSLQSVIPASRQWGSILSKPENHMIKVDFKSSFSMKMLWKQGFALTLGASICVRTLCYLCGSAGKHDLIYCNVCCEPFHEFCLEGYNQPSTGHLDDWCCPRCQFCHVCGRQNNLLQCDKCHDMYHPECLGSNYPTKPSKKKRIWICTKCVKCKSCGATTPGTSSNATWTYDFSLCYECGQLMDKGNFCPICRKCYSDDDWESKMVQCGMCESWVHARCEGLSDEMYEILSYMPEDMSFNCRKCFPVGCPEWEMTLKRELRNGLENILQTLIISKCAQYIYKYEKKSPKQLLKIANKEENEVTSKPKTLFTGDEKSDSNSDSQTDPKINTANHGCDNTVNKTTNDSTCKVETAKKDTDDAILNSSKSKEESKGDTAKTETDSTLLKSSKSKEESIDTCKGKDEHDGQNIKVSQTKTHTDTSNKLQAIGSPDVYLRKTLTVDLCRTSVQAGSTRVCSGNDHVNRDKAISAENKVLKSESVSNVVSASCESLGSISKGETTDMDVCDYKSVFNDTPKKKSEDNVTETRLQVSESGNTQRNVNSCLYSNAKIDSNDHNLSKDATHDNKTGGESTTTIHSDKILTTDSKTECKGENETSKVVKVDENSDKKCVNSVVAVKDTSCHVRFADEPKKSEDSCHPKDLIEVQEKMKAGNYQSVALFSEDVMRIIQEYLDDIEETRCTRKKSVNSARSVFVKQMERIFPWYNVKTCRYWYSNKNFPRGMLPDATLPPTTDHTYAQWLEREELPLSPQPSPFKKRMATPVKRLRPFDDEDGDGQTLVEGEDTRKCILCLKYGDQDGNDEGRLLYCGQDDWVHVNCALWSAEVYEDIDGSLQNIKEAYSRGKMLKCELCHTAGATVGCNTRGCIANYHFMCARQDNGVLQEDKKMFCKNHRSHADGEILSVFCVLRRVFIRNVFVKAVKKSWSNGLNAADISILIGSCTVECLGKLTDLSDRPRYLVPVNYMCTRVYWSTRDARRRCVYTCTVKEVHPEALKSPTVPIKDMRIVHDEKHPEYVPLSKLNLTDMGININEESTLSKPDDSNIVDLTSDYNASCHTYMDTTDDASTDEGRLAASFGGIGSQKLEGKQLSESWQGARLNKSEKQSSYNNVDFSVLSPETRKLLNIKDPGKYNKTADTTTKDESDDLGLLKIADRLNQAAAKSSHRKSEERSLIPGHPSNRSSRSPSVERNIPRPFSPPVRLTRSPSIERPFSPPIRMSSKSRSPSVEKIGSPVSLLSSTMVASAAEVRKIRSSSVEKMSERPFSPPLSALRRARSSSLEKCVSPITLPSVSVKRTPLTGCVVSSSNVTSHHLKPLIASSPVENRTKSCKTQNTVTIHSDGEENVNTSGLDQHVSSPMSGSEARTAVVISDTTLEKEQIEFSAEELNNPDIDSTIGETTETIVIMTDSGEEISEAEAILIAQAAVEQQSKGSISEDSELCSGENVKEVDVSGLGTDDQEIMDQVHSDETKDENVKDLEGSGLGADDQEIMDQVHSDETKEFADANELKMDKEKESDDEDLEIIEEPNETGFNNAWHRRNGNAIPPVPSIVKTSDSISTVTKNNTKETSLHVNDNKELASEDKHASAISKMDTDDSDSEIIDITDSIVKASNTTTGLDLPLENENSSINSSNVNTSDLIDSDIEILEDISCDNKVISKTESRTGKSVDYLKENSVNTNESKTIDPHSHKNMESCSDLNTLECDNLSCDAVEDDKSLLGDCNETSDKDIVNLPERNCPDVSELPVIENENLSKACLKEDAQEIKSDDEIERDEKNVCKLSANYEISGLTQKENKKEGIESDNIITDMEDEQNKTTIIPDATCTEDEIDGEKSNISENELFLNSLELKSNQSKPELTSNLSGSCESLHVDIIETTDFEIDNKCLPVVTILPDKEDSTGSQDNNIFERMKEFSFQSNIVMNVDERSEAEKNEVLRGLGLGRSEEVEKVRKSPKTSPVKTYPLRKNMMSPVRYRDMENPFNGKRNSPKGKPAVKPNEEHLSELPVHDPIAKKIKLESLAKSNPDEKGPFRCETCKRSYRTEASLKLHTEKCDFEVSTSDEDETENLSDSQHSSEAQKDVTIDSDIHMKARSSLRRSTMVQRVAIEVEEKRMKAESNVQKQSGRMSFPKNNIDRDVNRSSSKRKVHSKYSLRLSSGRDRNETMKKIDNLGHRKAIKSQQIKLKDIRKGTMKKIVKNPHHSRAIKPQQIKLKGKRKQLRKYEKQLSPITNSRLRQKILSRYNQLEGTNNFSLNRRNATQIMSTGLKSGHQIDNEIIKTKLKHGRGRPRRFLSAIMNAAEETHNCFSEEERNSDSEELNQNCSDSGLDNPGHRTTRGSQNQHTRESLNNNNVINLQATATNLGMEKVSKDMPCVKRGRGRPRKSVNEHHNEHGLEDSSSKMSNEKIDSCTNSDRRVEITESKESTPPPVLNLQAQETSHGMEKPAEDTSNVKRGRGRPRKSVNDQHRENASEDNSNKTSIGEVDSCTRSDRSIEITESTDSAPPLLRSSYLRNRRRQLGGNESDEPPVLELEVDYDRSSHPHKKRGISSLKKEVEAFRKHKRLKRENSQENVKNNIIEISSSDEEGEIDTNKHPGFRSNPSNMSLTQEVNVSSPQNTNKLAAGSIDNSKDKCLEYHSGEHENKMQDGNNSDKTKHNANNHNGRSTGHNGNTHKGQSTEHNGKTHNSQSTGASNNPHHGNKSNPDDNKVPSSQTKTATYLRKTELNDKADMNNKGEQTCKTDGRKSKNKHGNDGSETESDENQDSHRIPDKAGHYNPTIDLDNSKSENEIVTGTSENIRNVTNTVNEECKESTCIPIDGVDNNPHKNPVTDKSDKDSVDQNLQSSYSETSCKSNPLDTEKGTTNLKVYTNLKAKSNTDNNMDISNNINQSPSVSSNVESSAGNPTLSSTPNTDKMSVSTQSKSGDTGSSATSSSLSNTVLKLLKDGHKVLIKNPKLGRSFLWEKTERGYVGRPYETGINTNLSDQSPVGSADTEKSASNKRNFNSCRGSSSTAVQNPLFTQGSSSTAVQNPLVTQGSPSTPVQNPRVTQGPSTAVQTPLVTQNKHESSATLHSIRTDAENYSRASSSAAQTPVTQNKHESSATLRTLRTDAEKSASAPSIAVQTPPVPHDKNESSAAPHCVRNETRKQDGDSPIAVQTPLATHDKKVTSAILNSIRADAEKRVNRHDLETNKDKHDSFQPPEPQPETVSDKTDKIDESRLPVTVIKEVSETCFARTTALQLLAKKLAEKKSAEKSAQRSTSLGLGQYLPNLSHLQSPESNTVIRKDGPGGNESSGKTNVLSIPGGNQKLLDRTIVLSRSEGFPQSGSIKLTDKITLYPKTDGVLSVVPQKQIHMQKQNIEQEALKQTSSRKIVMSMPNLCKPNTGIEYLGGIVISSASPTVAFSSAGPVPVISQMPVQVPISSSPIVPFIPSLSTMYAPASLPSVHSQVPMDSQLVHVIQTGATQQSFPTILPSTSLVQNVPQQMAINQSLLPYTLAPFQPVDMHQTFLSQAPTGSFSALPTTINAGTNQSETQSTSSICKSLLPSTVPQTLNAATSSIHELASSQPSSASEQMITALSMKNYESVAKDVDNIIKNLQRHSQLSGNKPGFAFSDSSRATGGAQKELHKVISSFKSQHSSNYIEKVKQILTKKVMTPKTVSYHQKRSKMQKMQKTFYQEMKNGVVQGMFNKGTIKEKCPIRMEHEYTRVKPGRKKGTYKGKPGQLTPRKRMGRPPKAGSKRKKTPLKRRRIEGPHSLGSGSHPIIHGPKEVTSLPAAEVEEEVVETPLDALYDEMDTRPQGGNKSKENRGHLEFEIRSDDGFSCKSDTADGAWRQVIEKVQDARTASRLKQLSYGGLNGLSLSGLTHTNTVYLAEQLYGAGFCHTYKFRYHSHELRKHDEEPPVNPTGCIRTEPFDGRKPYDMFSFLMSRYRLLPKKSSDTGDTEMIQKSQRRATSMDLPMAMRFRKLKEHSREAVGVYRSHIHGRGLFCKRTIDSGEMIIEYAGEVIRGSLTDMREKFYESKGIGCYMFRIDDTDVVDATMKGSAARFINHSCEPNCFSKVINVDNRKHIVIFAMRPIQRGEELTYDYKFPIEDVKILCTCGSRRCRKYLN